MRTNILILLIFIFSCEGVRGQNGLPDVFTGEKNNDLISSFFKRDAEKAFNLLQVPDNKDEWCRQRDELRKKVLQHARVSHDAGLPLDWHETKSIGLDGYSVKNIYFQTKPQVFATANLYIPDGDGPFPGVVVTMGHSRNGKLYTEYQALGQTLALNGYVAIAIDPWGAGERSSTHGEFEYHGANLGASLLNVGETLMGIQIGDNMRAVDLLSSLPFVDKENIGATGASGGGNQAMWLAAMDERVKAVVPVVSVGTFQSYILNSNCICEALPGGLTFTEESAILGLIAPRALKICNGLGDSNAAFHPQEMLRSFSGAQKVYSFYDASDKLSYQIFDTPHGYFPVMREAMLGWFDLHLKNKGTGAPKTEKAFQPLPETELMVFPVGQRPSEIVTTADYCFLKGSRLRENMLADTHIDLQGKKDALKQIVGFADDYDLKHLHKYSKSNGWDRYVFETSTGELIPVLLHLPDGGATEYVLIAHSKGKGEIAEDRIKELMGKNIGICIMDLWGIGESASPAAKRIDGSLPDYHTLSRSALWLGKTIQGIWMNQLELVTDWLKNELHAKEITIDADREVAVASVLSSFLGNNADSLILRDMPLSYLFDPSGDINYFSMAIHIPGFLCWGDISFAVAKCNKNSTFISPVTMSGRELGRTEVDEFKKELHHFDSFSENWTEVHFVNLLQTP